jgi:acyl-homoserine-lactone acylase
MNACRILLAVACCMAFSSAHADDAARWKDLAAATTITRDDWGIAHINGHTDAQAVFGMVYAQAEDDFNRIEMNYLTSLGRLAEAEGQGALMQDLRARLYIDPADLRARYAGSPAWLKTLMDAWADGLNFFLATHPHVTPRVLRHFEPWMALAFSEGSIGGDIEDIPLDRLAAFYGQKRATMLIDPFHATRQEPVGSNGIAIAPANTRDHHALLLINPHTSFYFRAELQMQSDQGLNAYGAATWGQFFLYQGFNQRLGWMHTSTTADAVDEYLETIIRRDGAVFTRHGDTQMPVSKARITIAYRLKGGKLATRDFTIFKTEHGPVVGTAPDGRWISEAIMFKPVEALAQSFALTKARNYAAYMKVMALQANTSNNTVYADADGHIAFLYPQFIARRDAHFDYTNPVDGADPRSAWQGPLPLSDLPQLLDPATGWIQNTNDWPYSAAGPDSPKQSQFPPTMDQVGENMRGVHAQSLLSGKTGFTLGGLVAAAYDSFMPGFDRLIPRLLAAYDRARPADPMRARLADQIAVLRVWERRWSAESVPTSLAVYWAEALWRQAGQKPHDGAVHAYDAVLTRVGPAQMLAALADASDTLTRDFGTWRTPWGRINRFQRRTDDLVQGFSDSAPSLPVGFTTAQWGSLASITGPQAPGLKRRYGSSGNSFVAAVEFGDPVRAVAVSAGGESGDPGSRHFIDQAARYASGALRDVYFTPAQLAGHVERRYRPGE